MTLSKNDFLIGCLLGGIIGAATGMLFNKKFVNGVTHALSKNKRNIHETEQASSQAHSNNTERKVRRGQQKKLHPKKSAIT